MAGSQLKNLKATLKQHGLTGQTNIKKNKKNTKRKAKDYDREEKAKVIQKIREQFNPFEVKTAKNKRSDTGHSRSDSDRVAVGKPGISKQIGEDQRLRSYEARKSIKNKRGGVIDKRFGERDKTLTEEEKMLERFTRERQSQSKKRENIFNLEEDDNIYGDEDGFGMGLTHGGMALGDEIDENDDFLSSKRDRYDESADGHALGNSDQPARKKTKAEVMKEVITKSKFYKQERQKAQAKLEDDVDNLDDNFEDILSALMTTQPKKSAIVPKGEVDIEYDTKVRELNMEKRAAPADRTKTEEELTKEAEEKKKKMEQQRLDRMNGMVEDEEGEERGVEDLDDGFWSNDDEEEQEEMADSDDDIVFTNEDGDDDLGEGKFKKTQPLNCPSNHEELLTLLTKYPLNVHSKVVKKIIKTYQPKLAEGNKERLGIFTAVLLRHILFISGEDYSEFTEDFESSVNALIIILKTLSEKYNQNLSDESRTILVEIQSRFKKDHFSALSNSDLVFFMLVGSLFSTSDLYHLVATPSILLISELLDQIKFNSTKKLAYGAILASISLKYQRIAKRFIPELLYFFEKALTSTLTLSSDNRYSGLPKDTTFSKDDSNVLKLSEVFSEVNKTNSALQKVILLNILSSLDSAISNIWKDLPAFQEIISPIIILLTTSIELFPSLDQAKQILDRIERLKKFSEHIPLTLQNHKPISIPTHAPKFEENFNPDKKSYDPDTARNEVNKLKAQLKKERKFTMKEIRKDTRFEARQRIDEKKKDASEYHAKMAHIYNTISTEEGAEKNKYEREKKLRAGRK